MQRGVAAVAPFGAGDSATAWAGLNRDTWRTTAVLGTAYALVCAHHAHWAAGPAEPPFAPLLLGGLVVGWSLHRVSRSRGPGVLLVLAVALGLVARCPDYVPFAVALWAYCARVERSVPRGWGLGSGPCRALRRFWMPSLAAASLLFLAGERALCAAGSPGTAGSAAVREVAWTLLLGAFVLVNVAYLSAYLRDMDARRLRVID